MYVEGDGEIDGDGFAVECGRSIPPLRQGVSTGSNQGGAKTGTEIAGVRNSASSVDDGLENDDALRAMATAGFWVPRLNATDLDRLTDLATDTVD